MTKHVGMEMHWSNHILMMVNVNIVVKMRLKMKRVIMMMRRTKMRHLMAYAGVTASDEDDAPPRLPSHPT